MGNRILFVIGTLDVGGAETHLVRVARELKARAWEPAVFVLTTGGPLTSELVRAAIPVYGVDCLWCRKLPVGRTLTQQLLTMASLIRTMRTLRPVVCHFFLPAAYLFGGIAAMISWTRPRIMSRRSLRNYQQGHPIYTRIEHILHRRMDRVCGNSRAVVEQLAEERVPRERLRLIYNGINLVAFPEPVVRAGKRAEMVIADDVLVITVVANLIPYKGHADLIDALATIKTDMSESWLLLCLGRDDGIGASLRQRAEDAGVAQHIRWLGSRQDVPEVLAASDIGLLCSHQEGFSNAVLEGMAAGLPMVVTDVGGNAEAVVDGETGYVVPARQPQALAAAILRMALNPDRHAMGILGRARVDRCFSLSACVDSYEQLYREVQT
jgi:glycosyltransferase involved in cell wall biosynthesis